MKKFKNFLLRVTAFLLIFVCIGSFLAILSRTALPERLKDTGLSSLAQGVKRDFLGLYESIKVRFQKGDKDMIGGTGSGIISILLIGQDRRPGEETGRSDSMILCTFRPSDKTLILTSFLRDLYVQIPGHGSNRINAAFRFGGKDLLKKTLKENFNVHVDGTVLVDFDQFATVVDALGGVTVDLRADEAREINKSFGTGLSEGPQVLEGYLALAYARIRNLDGDGDFSRTDRQRKVLSAILSKVRQADLQDLKTLGKQILPHIDTDIGYFTALRLGSRVLPMLKGLGVQSQQIPASGEYQGRMIDGMAVLVPDLPKSRQRLQDTLLTKK